MGELTAMGEAKDMARAEAETEQYVTFTLGDAGFGVHILSVLEIRGWVQETPLPNVPDYVRGVINLRGLIIPVFDLRERFNRGRTDPTRWHVVLMVRVGSRVQGILVDAITDILTIQRSDILPVPSVDGSGGMGFARGLVSQGDRVITLLDIEHLFDANDLNEAELQSAARELGL